MLAVLSGAAGLAPGARLVRPEVAFNRVPAPRAAVADSSGLSESPNGALGVMDLAGKLARLESTPLAVAQLTDAIEYTGVEHNDETLASVSDWLRRTRRTVMLADLLRTDRTAYLETVSFLSIPRPELPNLQDVPIRACDPPVHADLATSDSAVSAAAEELVADCALPDVPVGENVAEAALLRITRDIYAGEIERPRDPAPGIRGLLEEMRRFMLSPQGAAPEVQQRAIVETLKKLMTPVLPPIYRFFMGGFVPSLERGDPRWLVDGTQKAVEALDKLPWDAKGALAPGKQLGPLPYAPLLTALVSPYAFGFLVGPAKVNLRKDGQFGGLVVEKCKFLQESNCKGMCLNSCKLPAQQLFDELGLPLRVSPNFETQECQWSFGEVAPPPSEDATWPKGCLVGCGSREAMRELQSASNLPACN